jgi:hypothetical protein
MTSSVLHINQQPAAEAALWDMDNRLVSLLERLRALESFMELAWTLDPQQVHAWAHDLGQIFTEFEQELEPFFLDSSHNSFVVDPEFFAAPERQSA